MTDEAPIAGWPLLHSNSQKPTAGTIAHLLVDWLQNYMPVALVAVIHTYIKYASIFASDLPVIQIHYASKTCEQYSVTDEAPIAGWPLLHSNSQKHWLTTLASIATIEIHAIWWTGLKLGTAGFESTNWLRHLLALHLQRKLVNLTIDYKETPQFEKS